MAKTIKKVEGEPRPLCWCGEVVAHSGARWFPECVNHSQSYKDKLLRQNKKYHSDLDWQEQCKDNSRNHRKRNREAYLQYMREYYIVYREEPQNVEYDRTRNRLSNRKRRLNPKFLEEDRAYGREYRKNRYATDPEYRQRHNDWSKNRRISKIISKKNHINKRDGLRCHLCLGVLELDNCHLDHIIPRSVCISNGWLKKETDSVNNLALAHAFCNMSRHDKVLPDEWDPSSDNTNLILSNWIINLRNA